MHTCNKIIYYYQHSATCFGAYCAILRENFVVHSVRRRCESVQQKPLSEPQIPPVFKSLPPRANHRVKGALLMP